MGATRNRTQDYPTARIIVWTAILTFTAAFWTVVGLAFLSWLRIG